MAPPLRRGFSARDGLRLSALEWPGPEGGGGKLPLLCLPGVARTALDFVHIGDRYGGTRRVVALEYAGHGESERARDAGRYRVEVALRDVLDAMAALHLHRVVLIGTSFGGILAMSLGVLRPGCLAAVAMNDIGPRLEPAGLDLVREVIGRDPAFATIEDASAFLQRALPPLAFDEAGWREVAETTYARGEDGRYHPRWDIRVVEAMRREDPGATELWPLFGALAHVPLLLFWGQESALLTASTVQRMLRERPDMAVQGLPGIGHAPRLVEPLAMAAMDRFLAAQP
ncbi:MAG: alpha/beta hydrolase [Acetobacteraceae bacterium]|nr:alpha/beta hydrolase [Acetobacteraceae bacterium]